MLGKELTSEGTEKGFKSKGTERLDSVIEERVLNFEEIEEDLGCDETDEVVDSEGLEELIKSDGSEVIPSSRRRKRNS